jgi:ABC-2 type transport system permease protein
MYKTLMRIFFKENFSLRRLFGTDIKKNKGKAILIGILLIYGLASVLLSFGYLFFDLGKTLNQFGLVDVLLIYAFIYGTMLSTMFVLFRANGYLFNYKDYEILEPLPIKTNKVIFAKATVMLTFILFSVFMFLAPILFSYFFHSGFDVLSLIIALVCATLIPVVPTIVFSFIALVIARISSKFRKSNILSIIILFVVFLGIMYLSISINSLGDTNPLLNQQEFMENLAKYYPFANWFVEAVNDHNILSLALYVLINLGLFIGFIFGIQKLVVSTNQRSLSKVTFKSKKAAKSVSRSAVMSIALKESRTFFNTPIYALNTGFGPVILLVLAVASIFFKNDLDVFFISYLGVGIEKELMLLVLIGFTMSMVYTTAISLSLEGKHFWILKSLPIKPITVMHGKMIFNILLSLPIAVISLLIFTYSIEIEFVRLILMILVTTSIIAVVTPFGSIVNLYIPKFEWRNPTEVVKQSAGTLLGMFGSWIILFIDGFMFFQVTKTMSFNVGLLMIIFLNIIFASIFLFIVNKKVESLFIKFEV